MNDLKAIIFKAIDLLNVRLSFGSFSFSMMQYGIALMILAIIIWFFNNLI